MMTCDDVEQVLTQYLLDELDERMDADIWTHLKSCKRCRASARELEPTLNLLQGALAATTPAVDHLTEERRARVLASDRQEGGRLLRWYREQRVSMTSVAAVLVLCFVLSFLAIPGTRHLVSGGMAEHKVQDRASRSPAAGPETLKLEEVVHFEPTEEEGELEVMEERLANAADDDLVGVSEGDAFADSHRRR